MEAIQDICAPPSHYPLKVISWKVSVGSSIVKDQLVAIYEHDVEIIAINEDGTESKNLKTIKSELRCAYEGTLNAILAPPGKVCKVPNLPLGRILEPCSHAVQLAGLCALCGKDLTRSHYTGQSELKRATIQMTHDSLGVTISGAEAEKIEKERTKNLLKRRKLVLLLDLDQTVIHATVDATVGEWMNAPDNHNFPSLKDVYTFTLNENKMNYFVKLRPGTRDFLEKMHELFELHIYTMGTRSYAREVAKILDPTGEIFMDRILSRDDSGSFHFKSIERLFPFNQRMVVVVDDRDDVWQRVPNLIKIKAYNYFQGIGDINEPGGAKKVQEGSKSSNEKSTENQKSIAKSPLTSSSNEGTLPKRPHLKDNDSVLPELEKLMINVHSTFYKSPEFSSVETIIPSILSKILKGVHLLFSGIIEILPDVRPESHDWWRSAEALGAVCYLNFDSRVTHVVAARMGTVKVNEAEKHGDVWILKREWFADCVSFWKRMDEAKYLHVPGRIPKLREATIDSNSQLSEDEPIYAKIGNNDWEEMDKEINDAIGSDLSDSDSAKSQNDEQDWLDFEAEIERHLNSEIDLEAEKVKNDYILPRKRKNQDS